jgi:SH3 domain-containing YSC84-like protein 1
MTPQTLHRPYGCTWKDSNTDMSRVLQFSQYSKHGTARFGSGVVVARLADGSWSAPSAIGTVGGGFGAQIGFEITNFEFTLNNSNAVNLFADTVSITLGINVSIAAGPVGRNAEAAGATSLKSVAGISSSSKTRGSQG